MQMKQLEKNENVVKVSERIFKSYGPSASRPVATKFDRFHDTEAKILEDIVCQSCSNIILEFRKKYPNIQLNIHTKN